MFYECLFVQYLYKTFLKRDTKSRFYSPKPVPIMMDEECNHYVKVCFKKAELTDKRFYHIVFLEICKSFNLMSKGLEAKKRFCVRGTSENFEKKWDTNLGEMERICRDLC